MLYKSSSLISPWSPKVPLLLSSAVYILIQVTFFTWKKYFFSFAVTASRVSILCVQGLMFLVYLSWAIWLMSTWPDTDTKINGLSLYSLVEKQLGFCMQYSRPCTVFCHILAHPPYVFSALVLVIGASICIFETGLFEANAIQFGLDQLLEAPTQKLIAFIHWYYRSKNVANLVFYLHNNFLAIILSCIWHAKTVHIP